jgi:hypothetical protein
MEAAAAGLRLIVPEHTAYLEYLGGDDAVWIPARPAPVQFEGTLGAEDWSFFGGLRWHQPDEDATVAILRAIIAGGPSRPPVRKRIIAQYAWNTAANRLIDILNEREAACPLATPIWATQPQPQTS